VCLEEAYYCMTLTLLSLTYGIISLFELEQFNETKKMFACVFLLRIRFNKSDLYASYSENMDQKLLSFIHRLKPSRNMLQMLIFTWKFVM